MRILYPFVGDTIGGSHLSVLLLIDALSKDQFEPHIVLHRLGALATYLDEQNITYTYLSDIEPINGGGLISQSLAMIAVAKPLGEFLRKHQIDIVHTNDARMHHTWLGAVRRAGCKHIWHQRSADNSRRLSVYAKLATSVVTISDHCKGALHSGLGSRAQVIYDPFDTLAEVPNRQEARAKIHAQCGFSSDSLIVGYVGNFTEQKRPVTFVEAAAKLARTAGKEIMFIMIGEQRQIVHESVKAKIASHGMGARIYLVGPRHPIEPWIAGLDFLLAPAINEGLGRTIIEAALMGTPVIASDDGGHCEIIEHGKTGYLVSPDDPDAMADCAAKLLSDPNQVRDITDTAGVQARQRFSIDQHVQAMVALYGSLNS